MPFLFICSLLKNLDDSIKTARDINLEMKKNPLLEVQSKPTWYYVQFPDTPNIDDLKKMGIDISSTNFLTRKWLKLFLSADQLSSLSKKFELHFTKVDSKLKISYLKDKQNLFDESKKARDLLTKIDPHLKLSNLKLKHHLSDDSKDIKNLFMLECSPDFNLEGFKFRRLSRTSLEVELEEPIEEKVRLLSEMDEIYSISQVTPKIIQNRFASPFIQNKEKGQVATSGLSPLKYINDFGLKGDNVTIVVSDSGLDMNNSFFYDPNVSFVFNQSMPNHRKVKFYWSYQDSYDEYHGHGTHVCGSVAGSPYPGSPDYDFTVNYQGVAPNAKLGFIDSSKGGSHCFTPPPGSILEFMNEVGAILSSNSYGSIENLIEANTFDDIEYHHDDKLFIIAAGNDGAYGVHTIYSPGSAKNVLTVGALEDVNKLGIGHPVSPTDNNDQPLNIMIYQLPIGSLYVPLNETLTVNLEASESEEGYIQILDFDDFPFDQIIPYLANYSGSAPVFMINSPLALDFISLMFQKHLETENRFYLFATISGIDAIKNLTKIKVLMPKYQSELLPTYFSSIGTTKTGLIKPEVSAPGSNIWSAGACDPKDCDGVHSGITSMDGTSMATPLTAGATALVQEYFEKGYYCSGNSSDPNCKIVPDACLLRAMMVASADPFSKNMTMKDGTIVNIEYYTGYGYGSINLANVLPISQDFKLKISRKQKIQNGQHLVGKVNVTAKRELRFVMAYLDVPLSPDSMIPLAIDLDMFVVGPDKKTIWLGNQRILGGSEHFSTVERVIIKEVNVTEGEYEIHVYSRDILNFGTVFSLVSVGMFDSTAEITFSEATEDVFCNEHGVPSSNHLCKCNDSFGGILCQYQLRKVGAEKEIHFIVLPNDPIIFTVTVPEDDQEWYIHVRHSYREPGNDKTNIAYLSSSVEPPESPIEFDTVVPYTNDLLYRVTGLGKVHVMINNIGNNWENIDFFLVNATGYRKPTPTPTSMTTSIPTSIPSTTDSIIDQDTLKSVKYTIALTGCVIGGVLFVVLIVVLIILVISSRKKKVEEQQSTTSTPFISI